MTASRTGAQQPLNTFDRWVELSGGGPFFLLKGQFGPSIICEAVSRLLWRHRNLAFTESRREFTSVPDWGRRWPTEQQKFAAGVILTPAREPIVERAVGRCLADLYQLGRPLLWGVVSGSHIRWYARFKLVWNGWPVALHPPPNATYARLSAAPVGVEFHPQFDPILYTAEADFAVTNSRLHWAYNPLWFRGVE